MTAAPAPIEAVVAVDWSGALVGQQQKIWLCEVRDGTVTRLEAGRTREQLCDEVLRIGRETPATVAGFDFGFSVPAWFFGERGLRDAHALWELAAHEGEAWLTGPIAPFWGRNGATRPTLPAATRATEDALGTAVGRRPSSVFKLVGADQVGAGSVRGMATLARLAADGWAVWPFDDVRPDRPIAIEVWPRALYRDVRVTKSSAAARARYLAEYEPDLPERFRAPAVATRGDDAFDALTAALAMWRGRASFAALPSARDATERLEGRIWTAEVAGAPAP